MILVLDLGTTYFKLALVDRRGELVEVCRVEPPIRGERPGLVELDAKAFVEVIEQGIADLAGRVQGGLADINIITFATQTNSFVLLAADGRPLTPIILWPDDRAADLEDEFHRRCCPPAFRLTTGIPAASVQCMTAKLLWMQRSAMRTWKRTAKICLISDYLTLLLTGRHVTEAGAAGLTGLLNIHDCRWHPESLAGLGIPHGCLPEVVRAGTDLGSLDGGIAGKAFGKLRAAVSSGCRFVVGCLDQYAGAIGAGNVDVGTVSETTGTVLATVRCDNRFHPLLPAGVFQGPSFAERLYYQMVFGEVSANYLEWCRNRLPNRSDFDRLAALAGQVEAGANGLRLRTNVAVTGNGATTGLEDVFEGLTPHHTDGHMARCIMEAVASALQQQVNELSNGVLPCEIRSVGGGARSELWLQIKADTLGIPVRAMECPEPTSLGAAILAEAASSGRAVAEVARHWVQLKPPHFPDPERHRRYQAIQSRMPNPS